MVYHADILAPENIRPPLVLFHGHREVRALLFDYVVAPPARLRARTAVGPSAGEIITEQASAGISDAHGAVYKAFEFDVIGDGVSYLADLGK